MNTHTEGEKPSVKQRVWHELKTYFWVSLYLWLCFGVLFLYESAMLKDQGQSYLHFGVALVKALVIGKFILIGEAIKVGDRGPKGPTLAHRIVWKTFAFLVMLIIFHVLEEIIVGWVHGKGAVESLTEFFSSPWIEILAPTLVMTLVLIPLISTLEISKAMGRERFRGLLLGRE